MERFSPRVRRADRHALTIALALLLTALPAAARKKPPEPPAKPAAGRPTVAVKTAGMDRHQGFLTFYLDAEQGKIWLEVPAPSGPDGHVLELLYTEGLTTGLGSNPVGLDRGQLNEGHILRLRRIGPKVFFEVPNFAFRAVTDNATERRATAESFATSIVWAGEIAALDPDGRSLVDWTSFVIQDAHNVVQKLRETGQGAFTLDRGRSVLDLEGCLAFPDNVELEAILTFAGAEPGGEVKSTVPAPKSVTLVQYHSLIRLPDDGYRPRRFDPRVGFYAKKYRDYAAALDQPVERRLIARHRLEKSDPTAERSAAVEPLIFYVDPGIPEPVLGAVLDGVGWWAEAFEAAGFIDAFRVELLPEDVHPLDVRYNTVQWVHRATRGWSYGGGVIDPRTGEILKGHVNLGSLRVRQDRLLFEGLAGTAKTGTGAADDPIEIALARIRQLAAHEVGHTLGLDHNFAASTFDDRASVMDYPAPLVTVGDNGQLDFSRAYGVGVGSWDLHSIRYGYSQFAEGVDEAAALDAIARDGIARGMVFLGDKDARPPGAAEPRGNLWDNGTDAVEALEEVLAVRRLAIQRFQDDRVLEGTALAELEEVFAPVYFHHRYQLEAAVKTIGGMEYNYALRGDGQWATRTIPAERQRRALQVILGVLSPAALDIPERVLGFLAPRAHEYDRHREMFASRTGPVFDALGAARTAADQALGMILQPERLGRLLDFHRRDPELPGIEEVVDALIETAFGGGTADEAERDRAIREVIQRGLVDRLLVLSAMPELEPSVRARLEWGLREVHTRLAEPVGAHQTALVGDIDRFLDRDQSAVGVTTGPPAPLPPGSPIGGAHLSGCAHGG